MRALLGALLALLAAAPAAQATFPGRNGRIAVSDDTIIVLKPNGRAGHRIAEPRTFAPRWSPDGRRIAFVVPEGSRYVVRIANADGSDPRTVPLPFSALDPAWSPDGRRLLVTRTTGPRDARRDVYRVDPDGSALERLVANALEASWSPDGKRIAYITVAGDGC